MNHYERLKVSPEAPIEVIRAAYRALAAKHHPDRHTQSEVAHGDMAALNAAYETLADPAARAAYDAALAQAQEDARPEPDNTGPSSRLQGLWRSTMGFGTRDTTLPPEQEEQDESRVDVRWQPPPLPSNAGGSLLTSKRFRPMLVVLGVVVLVAGGLWLRVFMQQVEAEQTLSEHYGGQTQAAHSAATLAGDPESLRKSAAEMSNEELLAELSSLTGGAVPSARAAANANHVLDGSPLSLRPDTHLVDPLALSPAPRP